MPSEKQRRRKWRCAPEPVAAEPATPSHPYARWLEDHFVVHHTPGVARALMYCNADGSYVLLTGEQGYDLPAAAGPFSTSLFAVDNRLLAGPLLLADTLALAVWMRGHSDCPIPTDLRLT